MEELDPCQRLIAAARTIPRDERVPYAFEKRVMARLAGQSILDPWAIWGQGLARAAVMCVAVTILLAAGSYFVPPHTTQVSLPQAVQQALFAGLDNSLDQIGDTP